MVPDEHPPPSIELVVEGPVGEVTLDDVIGALQDSLHILRQVDAARSGRANLDWVVSAVSLGSFKATIEPRRRAVRRQPGRPRTTPEALSGSALTAAGSVARDFAIGLQEVQDDATIPQGWSKQIGKRVQHLGRRLETGTARGFTVGVRSADGDVTARMGPNLRVRAEYALEGGGTRRSVGSLIGRLEVISARKGKKTFGLYTAPSGPAVKCFFGPEHLQPVMNAFEHWVLAEGIITRRADGDPVSILVSQFEQIPNEARPTVEELRGSRPHITGGLASVDFIRQQRRAQ